MEPVLLAATVGIGAVAGLFAGLLGIGGGVIMAPLLLFVFEQAGMPAHEAATAAIATSLAAILFTAVPSSTVHARHGSVNWRILAWLSPAAVVGSVVAAWIAQMIAPVLLVGVLVAMLVASVARIVFRDQAGGGKAGSMPGKPASVSIGLAAGFLGTLTGTGGGVVVAPLLARLDVPLVVAIGTSAGNVAVISVAATLSFGGKGLSLPFLAALAPTSMVMAAVGAKLANVLPLGKLRVVYALCLSLIILRLCYWIWTQLQ